MPKYTILIAYILFSFIAFAQVDTTNKVVIDTTIKLVDTTKSVQDTVIKKETRAERRAREKAQGFHASRN